MKITAKQMRSDKDENTKKNVEYIIELIEQGLIDYDSDNNDSGFIKVNTSTAPLPNSEEIIKRVVSEVCESGFDVTHVPYKYEELNGGIDFFITQEHFKISW